MIKKVLRFLVILLLTVIGILFIAYIVVDKPLPNGTQGDQAENLADQMLSALNKPAFDSLEYISFTFRGVHTIQWDKANNHATVIWPDNEVYVDLNKKEDDYTMLEYQAYQFFINDSFWLVAPFKVRDDGVIRSSLDTPVGKGLLVSYTSGGVTPGDSYLWILDEKGFPISWKLWTSNVPIGGLTFTWENWEETKKVWFSTMHRNEIMDITITDLEVR